MSSRERQLWTEFVRKREERKDREAGEEAASQEAAADTGGA